MTEMTEMREELQQALQLERTFTVQVEAYLSDKHLRPTEEGTFSELLQKYKHYLLRRQLLVVQGSLEECKDPSHEAEIERMRGKLFAMAHGTTKTKTKKKRLKQINKVKVNCGKCEHPQLFYTDTDGPYELVVDSGTGKQVRKYKELEILQWVLKGDLPKVTEPFMMMSMERDMTEAPEALRKMEKLYKESYALFGATSNDLLSKTADCKALCEAMLSYLIKEDNLYRSIKVCAEEAVTAINEQYGEAPNGRRNPEKDRLMGRCLWLGIRRRMVHEAAKKLQALHERYREKKKAGRAHKAPTAYGGFQHSVAKGHTSASLPQPVWQVASKSPTRKNTGTRGQTQTYKAVSFSELKEDSSDSDEDEDEACFETKKKPETDLDSEWEVKFSDTSERYKKLSDVERQFQSIVVPAGELLRVFRINGSFDPKIHVTDHMRKLSDCLVNFSRTLLPMVNGSGTNFLSYRYEKGDEYIVTRLRGIFKHNKKTSGVCTGGPVRKLSHAKSDELNCIFRPIKEPLNFFVLRNLRFEWPENEMGSIGFFDPLEGVVGEYGSDMPPVMNRCTYEGMEYDNKRVLFGMAKNYIDDRCIGLWYPHVAEEEAMKILAEVVPATVQEKDALWTNKSSPVIADLIIPLSDTHSVQYQGMFNRAGLADGFGELRHQNEGSKFGCNSYTGMWREGQPEGIGMWCDADCNMYLGIFQDRVMVRGLYTDGIDPWVKCTWTDKDARCVSECVTGPPSKKRYWEIRVEIVVRLKELRTKVIERLAFVQRHCRAIPFKGIAKEEKERQLVCLEEVFSTLMEKIYGAEKLFMRLMDSYFGYMEETNFRQRYTPTSILRWNLDMKLEVITAEMALKSGNLSALKRIIKNGFDPSKAQALHLAAQEGQAGVVKLLVETYHMDPMRKNNKGNTPLHLAAYRGHAKVVKLLAGEVSVTVRNNNGMTPLMFAAYKGHTKIVRLFVEKYKASAVLQNTDGHAPMHMASQEGYLELMKLLAGTYEVDVMVRDKLGNTPLHLAAYEGHFKAAKLLVEKYGAECRTKNKAGDTAIRLASGNLIDAVNDTCSPPHTEMARWMTKWGVKGSV